MGQSQTDGSKYVDARRVLLWNGEIPLAGLPMIQTVGLVDDFACFELVPGNVLPGSNPLSLHPQVQLAAHL